MRKSVLLIMLVGLAACGGDDDEDTTTPTSPAARVQNFTTEAVVRVFKGMGSVDAALPFLANLASPGATGFAFAPDNSEGAPANRYVFTIPLDGDGDGVTETELAGNVVLDGNLSDPTTGFHVFTNLTVESVDGFGDFVGQVDLTLTAAGTQLWGQGVCTTDDGETTTTLHIAPEHPLLVKQATGATEAVANACGYSLEGDVGVEVDGPDGFLGAVWEFLSTSATARVTDATYRSPAGEEQAVPDSDVNLTCGGRLSDWAGVFVQNYSCLPPEYGTARLTITVTGPSTIHIVDEDPPGSGDTNEYDAAMIAGSAHAVRGHFFGGPTGFTYREDFTWTLAEDGSSFNDVSVYEYQEGPNLGNGGFCSGYATRGLGER